MGPTFKYTRSDLLLVGLLLAAQELNILFVHLGRALFLHLRHMEGLVVEQSDHALLRQHQLYHTFALVLRKLLILVLFLAA